MTEPEFRLLPWERGGHPVAPSVAMNAIVEGHPRSFWVKQHNGGVYFRFADEGEEDVRVWTLTEYDEHGTHELESVFRDAIAANRVARFLTVERGFSTQTVGEADKTQLKARFHSSNLHLMGPTCFGVAVNDDGHAFAQEWCGGSWVEFDLKPRAFPGSARRPSIWSRNWNVAGLKTAMAPLAGQFAFRPFAFPVEKEEPFRFAQGSEGELEALFRAAHVHFITSFLAARNRGKGWRYGIPATGSQTMRFGSTVYSENRQSASHYNSYWSVIPNPLMDLFVKHNLPVGGSWMHYDRSEYFEEEGEERLVQRPQVELNRRVDFNFSAHHINLSVEVACEPSAHERMEAGLMLREWLQEKGYGSQSVRLLSL